MKIIKILESLVEIPSVFPNEEKIALLIEKFLKSCGFKTERQMINKTRWNLLAERGIGKKSILFYGHMDTVPSYGKWETNPYKLTAKNNKLYGLGACDMKGGLASILNTVQIMDENRKIKVFFGVDEENISEGVWSAIENKREWFNDVELVVVAEPGASLIQTGGANVITLGRRGRVVLSIEIYGKSSHGANPRNGVNAIDQLIQVVKAINKIKLKKHPLLGESSLFIRKIESKSTSLSMPDKAYLELDIHFVLPETIESVKNKIEKIILDLHREGSLSGDADQKVEVNVKKRITPYMKPYVTDVNNLLVKKIIKLIKTKFGNCIINYGSSVADDNVFADILKIPVVTIGPQGENIHSANEWVSGKSVEEVSELYSLIVKAIK